MVSRKAVRQALYSKLSGSSTITNVVNFRIYHAVAPPNATYPLLIFNKQAGTLADTFGPPAFDQHVWLVKAVDRNSTSNAAEDLAAAIDALLHDGTLTITGQTFLDSRRTSDVDYLETEGDQAFRHHGALYRLTAS